MDIETKLFNYLSDFNNSSEKEVLYKTYNESYDHDDTTPTDLEYLKLTNIYNQLLNSKISINYRIEIGPNCSFLIDKLFKRYVNDNTFVLITEEEHPAVKVCLEDVNTIYVLKTEDIKRKDVISSIVKTYKESKCTNLFLMMGGVIPSSGELLDDLFFSNLKAALIKENISHVMILDDCQGIYFTSRNYSIFDGILGTAHVLVKSDFEMGILLTKLKHKIGYINKSGIKHFLDKLEIVMKHKKQAEEFRDLIEEYFKDELNDGIFKINNTTKHIVSLKSDGVKFNQKYVDKLKPFYINFSELNSKIGFIRLRYQEAIKFEPDKYIEALKDLKKILKSLKRTKEFGIGLTFDNKPNINYDFNLSTNHTKKVSDINTQEITSIINKKNLNYVHQDIVQYNNISKVIIYRYIFENER